MFWLLYANSLEAFKYYLYFVSGRIIELMTIYLYFASAVRLECSVKNYHWGKVGSESKVAQFAKANADEFTIEEGSTYAEVSKTNP